MDAREDDRSVGPAAREDDLQAGAGGMDVQETDAGTGLAGVAGLTSREAEARRRRGEGNVAVSASSRSYARILRTNVFSFFNVILFVIGAALLALGRYNDAFTSVGLGLVNAAISAVQEIRAKRKLDRLQLLSRSPVTVLRDGRETSVAQEDVVRGDVLCVRPGDQVVVDGPVLDGGRVEVDESLLTGESEPQLREPGEDLLSGSLCVGGGGHQLARDVGASSYASRLTAEARQASTDTTPLQRRIQFVVRLVMVLVALMSAAILLQAALEGFSLVRVVQTTAVLSGLVPYGLFFLVAVAYTVGAAKSSGRGALVQQVNAVESVSNVDVLCTDKTGTLTTGRLSLAGLRPVGPLGAAAVEHLVGSLARSTTAANLTSSALAAALPGAPWEVREEVPFSSSLRWSALRTDDGAVVLGAPDALAPALSGAPLTDAVDALTGRGLRVLVVARAADPAARLRDDTGRPRLPALEPLAVVALADELRPDVPGTLAGLIAGGTAVKVVSGDDPRTVAALARQAGLDGGQPVTGADLDALSDREFDDVVARTTVFGRIAPEQKERLVASLRRQGRYVAMVGDGVNDARAIKRAHVGVAMRSGSAVTRDVADIVLTDDSLTALLPARQEGRRIISGIGTSMQVFLARVGTQGLVILTVTMLGLGFPYSPANVGLTLLTVGLPTLFLTMWARPAPPDPHLLTSLWRFVVPAMVVTAAGGVAVYAYHYTTLLRGFSGSDVPDFVVTAFERWSGVSSGDVGFAEAAATIGAQTALSTFVSYAAFLLILFLRPPTRLFASWTRPDGDRRPAVLVAVLVVAFTAGLFVEPFTDYFGLTHAADPIFRTVLPALVVWFALLTAAYRFRLLERALGLQQLPGATRRG
ncbi:MAG TPA: HAD-IC family P-type ATPase [Geodermatophilus sp.]|nr:HAD-IC family P-type ATPase [Geodermatophilus sp.]